MTGDPDELNELLRQVQAIKRQIGEASDRLDDVIAKLRALVKRQVGTPWLQPAPATDAEPAIHARDQGNGTPLVKLVTLERQFDGLFVAQIGEEPPLPFPESLASLLALLAESGGDYVIPTDPFVGWKSWESLVEKLGLRNHHAVSGRINRLRKLLKHRGLNRKLVQTSPAMGARFGLSRKGVLVIDDEAP